MKRTFIIGEEWVYYKIYCGIRTADAILIDMLMPLTKQLLASMYIDHWFFIRYTDPHPHLRIRFHSTHQDHLAKIIKAVQQDIQPYVDQDQVWRVQIDTYQRELERYGIPTMETCEQLFYYDSTCCLKALSLIEDETLLFLFALKSIDHILHDFEYDLHTKMAFTKKHKNAFAKEFHTTRETTQQLAKKYQGLRKEIRYFMALQKHADYDPILKLLTLKSKQHTPHIQELLRIAKCQELHTSLDHLLSSIIHMMINRLFRAKQRMYEWICYDMLTKYYMTQVASIAQTTITVS